LRLASDRKAFRPGFLPVIMSLNPFFFFRFFVRAF